MPLRHLVTSLVLAALLGATAAAPGATAAERRAPAGHDPAVAGLVLQLEEQAPGPAAADLRYPAAPTAAYRPRFVRQTGRNCAFASAAMLIDKWTTGDSRPSQERLRAASRVPATKGVNLGELARAVARVTGMELRYSPGGGDPMTWDALMSRLARGGGAVLGGAYSRLPRHYQRWARDFASQGASGSGHAVYIERYEQARGGGRVWMMDPLAKSAGYSGEWISVRALRHFAWRNARGLVSAAATPEPLPLAGFEFGTPELDPWARAGEQAVLRVPLTVSSGWPLPKHLAVSVDWQLLAAEPDIASLVGRGVEAATDESAGDNGDGLTHHDIGPRIVGTAPPAADDPELEVDGTAEDGQGERLVRLEVRDGYLVGLVGAPSEPGLYRLGLELRHRDGRSFAPKELKHLGSVDVPIRGALAAEMSSLNVTTPAVQGTTVDLELVVANRGSRDWLGEDGVLLVANWETPVGTLAAGSSSITLAAGEQSSVTISALVPTLVGEGEIRLELFSAEGAPLSAFGADALSLRLRFADPPTSGAALLGA